MRWCIFEDHVDSLEPLSLTRPVFDLRCGMTTLAEKLARVLEMPIDGVLVRPVLAELYRDQHPNIRVNDVDGGDDLLLVNGCWMPSKRLMPSRSCVGMIGNSVAYVMLRERDAKPIAFDDLPRLLEQWQETLPIQQADGSLAQYPWDLVAHNADEIRRDFAWLDPAEERDRPGVHLIGPTGELWIAPTSRVEPMVMIDTTHGPVVIDEHAVVSAFTRLEGPCTIGPRTQILGAKIRGGTSIGPQCRIGGEVEASIIHGYSNKYHDGFLGHAYVGEWVNLGAGTHNSDLRNDYGEVTMYQRGASIATGTSKVGCFLGDHTKTGLGTLFNTGTSIGAFCNLLPNGRFAPKEMPPFTSWWNGSLTEAFTLEQLLTTAELAMQRRGVTLTDAHRRFYAGLFDDTSEQRRRAIRESEQRRLRKSA